MPTKIILHLLGTNQGKRVLLNQEPYDNYNRIRKLQMRLNTRCMPQHFLKQFCTQGCFYVYSKLTTHETLSENPDFLTDQFNPNQFGSFVQEP